MPSSPPDVFGPIITGKDVREAVVVMIKRWEPTYRALINDRYDKALPAFRSYVAAVDLDKMVEDQVPSCVVVAPGLMDVPERHARDGYVARWAVGVGVVVSGLSRENTLELAELYAAIVRSIILQQYDESGIINATYWVGERYDELDTTNARTLAAGVVQFGMDVESVVNPIFGPATPDESGVFIVEDVEILMENEV